MHKLLAPLVVLGLLLAGCVDDTTTRPIVPPAAPRGLFSVTGDGSVTLVWLANTESDVVGYRIYRAPCASGEDCPYERIGSVSAPAGEEYVQYVITGLANGETAFFAVSAVDRDGLESDLSWNDVFDTPRPAGTALVLRDYHAYSSNVGYDFSAFIRTDTPDPPTDIFYGVLVDADSTGYVFRQIFVPDYGTNIQDAGYAASLDAVDFASTQGWSPSGTVEAVVGHNYVVWTRDNHFAKFRVTAVSNTAVTLDWAYQIDPGNQELAVTPTTDDGVTPRRPVVWLRR
jgi:hypothetical protein